MTKRHTMRDNSIVVLNDGETYAGLDGCFVAEVIFDGFRDTGAESQQTYEQAEILYSGDEYWHDPEGQIIAKIIRSL